MSLLSYEQLFANLRMNTAGPTGKSRKSPHKVAMLLAVIDLIATGVILQNKIFFDQSLKDAFTHRFNEFATENDRNNPQLPFFHLRKEEGDGLGFDIRSFNPERDEELFIEVKTTSSGKYQPFYITDNEVAFSKDKATNYCLYRVYDFRREARLFMLRGAIEQYVSLAPKNFKAEFTG